MTSGGVREQAYAKLNLVLRVGPPQPGTGLHPICSLFASIDLADDVHVGPTGLGEDVIECPGVQGPNLAAAAITAFRERVPSLPPLGVRIGKRIPVAAGLGGGSADAAAVLRAANRIAGDPLDVAALRVTAATLGSDVPSQVEPRHSLVQGTGERVEPIELPPLAAVLVPHGEGLSTADVYAELDRIEGWRHELDPEPVRQAANDPAANLENDLRPAALNLRPELAVTLADLRATNALAVEVSGSGPTCFGLFPDRAAAEAAAATLPSAMTAELRQA